jgi:hypothetical protein
MEPLKDVYQGAEIPLEIRTGSRGTKHVDIVGYEKNQIVAFLNDYLRTPGYDIAIAQVNTPNGIQTVIRLKIKVDGKEVTIELPFRSKGIMPTPTPGSNGGNGGGGIPPNPTIPPPTPGG